MARVLKASDTFTRADSQGTLGSPEVGPAWGPAPSNAGQAVFGVKNNQAAYHSTVMGNPDTNVTLDLGNGDIDLSVTVDTTDTTNGGDGLIARSTSNVTKANALTYALAGSSLQLLSYNNFTQSPVYTVSIGSAGDPGVHTYRMLIVSERIFLFLDGVPYGDHTMGYAVPAHLLNAQYHGLRLNSSGSITTGGVGPRYDNFTAHKFEPALQIRRSAGSVNRRVFTTSGTWTKPDGLKSARVICIGGGGGGGSGRKNTGTNSGGGGGAGGCYSVHLFRESDLPATVAITAGAGGTGGAAQTSNGTGNGGTAGGASSFGSLLRAVGGNPGSGGAANSGTAGSAATSGATDLNVIAGLGDDVVAGGTAGNVTSSRAAGSGGGGGGASAGPNATNGGAGGSNALLLGGVGGGSAGTITAVDGSTGGHGGNGISGIVGTGGGGGAAGYGTSANGGNGGNGGFPGGGGGGGGSTGTGNGTQSGAGGNGASGVVIVEEYF